MRPAHQCAQVRITSKRSGLHPLPGTRGYAWSSHRSPKAVGRGSLSAAAIPSLVALPPSGSCAASKEIFFLKFTHG